MKKPLFALAMLFAVAVNLQAQSAVSSNATTSFCPLGSFAAFTQTDLNKLSTFKITGTAASEFSNTSSSLWELVLPLHNRLYKSIKAFHNNI